MTGVTFERRFGYVSPALSDLIKDIFFHAVVRYKIILNSRQRRRA